MKPRRLAVLLRVLGLIYLAVGLACALLGPIELYVYYLFSAGGRFYYDGFGFGSFLFGFIALQIAGYYVIAAILVPLGYGHLRLRPWARHLAESLLWCWLVLGIPVLLLTMLTALGFKELSLPAAITMLAGLALTYPLLPILLLLFYRSPRIRSAFQKPALSCPSWIERIPVPSLALAILLAFIAVVLHFPIFLNGLFPLFGSWLTGLEGIICLTACIVLCLFLSWAVVQGYDWARWTAVAFLALMVLSTILTFATTAHTDLLGIANFPPREIGMLDGIPLQGWMLAAFFALPLIGTIVVALLARPSPAAQQSGA